MIWRTPQLAIGRRGIKTTDLNMYIFSSVIKTSGIGLVQEQKDFINARLLPNSMLIAKILNRIMQ